MLEFSPQDAGVIREFIRGIRVGLVFDQLSSTGSLLERLQYRIKFMLTMTTRGRDMQKWLQTTMTEFAARFKDPVIRQALVDMWFPEFSVLFLFLPCLPAQRDAATHRRLLPCRWLGRALHRPGRHYPL
jgi:hypothetical protein